MKKNLLACMLGLISAPTFALPFDGFYVSGIVGGTKAIVHGNQDTNALLVVSDVLQQNIIQQNTPSQSDTSWIGGVELGLGHVFAQYYYLGLEGTAQFENIQSSNWFSVTPTPTTNINYTHNDAVELKNELAITFNPGIVINKTTLIYGKIGPTWGRFTSDGDLLFASAVNPTTQLNGYSQFNEGASYKAGLRLGLGIEHYFMQHLSLKLEYLNSNYGQVTSGKTYSAPILVNGATDPVFAGSMVTQNNTARVQTNTVMLGLTYHFSA
jgi:opacity protein-like surface antigen